MKNTILTERRLSVIEEQMKENAKEHQEIKDGIVEVKDTLNQTCKELIDLKTNHIVFKTRVVIYWGIGVGILSAVVQLLIGYLSRHL